MKYPLMKRCRFIGVHMNRHAGLSNFLIMALIVVALAQVSCTQNTVDGADAGDDTGGAVSRCPVLDPDFKASDLPNFLPMYCDDSTGSGVFGRWGLDGDGLPVYSYGMDQTTDARAKYTNSEGDGRIDHWHAFGNGRVTAMAHNGGHIELFNADRVPMFANGYDPATGSYSGGFAYIRDGDQAWNTRYDGDRSKSVVRQFLMGGFRTVASKNGLTVERRVKAVKGGVPALENRIILQNDTGFTKHVEFYEYWDLNLVELNFAIVGGVLSEGVRESRREFAGNFTIEANYDYEHGAVIARERVKDGNAACDRDEPCSDDYYPKPVYMAFTGIRPDRAFLNQRLFFGKGGVALPDAVTKNLGGETTFSADGLGQPAVLVLGKRFEIEPGGSVGFGTAFGHYDENAGETIGSALDAVKNAGSGGGPLFYLGLPDHPWVTRELSWHAAYLEALLSRDDGYGTVTADQGGAYLFLEGLNGAPRDFALANIPLTFIAPEAAKDNLRTMMRLQEGDGRFWYAMHGVDSVTGAMIHNNPSDLGLFFMWALSEYLMATRDFKFLLERVPYRTASGADDTVSGHAAAALKHFNEKVGKGVHGLARILDGDWNDGLLLRSPDQALTKVYGESAFNSAMACYVLPLLGDALDGVESEVSAQAFTTGAAHCSAMKSAWTGTHFLRGFVVPDMPLGKDESVYLEPQPFALLGGIADGDKGRVLAKKVHDELEAQSPIGPVHLYPPSDIGSGIQEIGSDTNGGIWHALNGLWIWAVSGVDPDRSWEIFMKSGMVAHAEAYPEIWYGIWSGPDSFNAWYHERAGETFIQAATPMTDYPVMNSNQHVSLLLAAIKSLGVIPVKGGFRIAPAWKHRPFVMKTRLLDLSYSDKEAAFSFRPPVADAVITVTMALPSADPVMEATVNGLKTEFEKTGDGYVKISASCSRKTGCLVVIR
jgi:hypothetical protein